VRPTIRRIARQSHFLKQSRDPCIRFGTRLGKAEIAHRLGQNGTNLEAGIEACKRILEHDLDALAHWPQRGGREIIDAPAAQNHLACRDIEQPEDRLCSGGFATARFTYERKGLARVDMKRDAVDGMSVDGREQPGMKRKVLLQIPDLEQWSGHALNASRRAK
jgi:hypothetical protein